MTNTQELIALAKSSHSVIKELILDVNLTGGFQPDPEKPQLQVPKAAPQWLDLALTAEKALHHAREIEAVLNAAGHPIPEHEKCPDIIQSPQT